MTTTTMIRWNDHPVAGGHMYANGTYVISTSYMSDTTIVTRLDADGNPVHIELPGNVPVDAIKDLLEFAR
jgi:hypothetical protein